MVSKLTLDSRARICYEWAALKKGQNAFFQVVIKMTKIFFLSNGIFYTDQPCGKFYFSKCFLYSLNFSVIKLADCIFSVFLVILAAQRGFCICFESPSTHVNSKWHTWSTREWRIASSSLTRQKGLRRPFLDIIVKREDKEFSFLIFILWVFVCFCLCILDYMCWYTADKNTKFVVSLMDANNVPLCSQCCLVSVL